MPPPRSARRKPPNAAPDVTVKVDGVAYGLRVDEISALDATALRRATGLSVQGVLRAAETDADLDIVAAIVFLARRQAGETVTYDDVAADLNYGSDIDLGDDSPAEDVAGDAEGEGPAAS